MIKKFLLLAAIIFPMLASAQTVKIGIVDTASILQAMPETTAAQTKMQETSAKYDATYKELIAERQRIYEAIQNMPETELPAIKNQKVADFQNAEAKIANFEQSATQELQKLQEQLMTPIIAKVQTAIESVGKEGNYTMVYDNNPQIILYHGAPAEDITPLVKTKLGIR